MKKIRVAIAGVGNCASSLVQGVSYYKDLETLEESLQMLSKESNESMRQVYNISKEANSINPHDGLMHPSIGGYKPTDIDFVCAFDVDKRKVNKRLEEAIFAQPNNTMIFQEKITSRKQPTHRNAQIIAKHKEYSDLFDKSTNLAANAPVMTQTDWVRLDELKKELEGAFEEVGGGAPVYMAPVLDGVADHMADFPEHQSFRVSDVEPVDVVKKLIEHRVDVLVNYMPVGSQKATEFYAQCCLDAGVAMVNCIPVFIASNPIWANKFKEAGLPIIGDDIRSQVGASILHAVLTQLFLERGYTIEQTYQLNFGGNTDFMNMLERSRLESKKISKTNVVTSQMELAGATVPHKDNIHIGPSDYVPFLKDNKVANIRMVGKGFGGAPIELECKLSVQDSPNSAGVVIDAIRYLQTGRNRGYAGPMIGPSGYLMKTPPLQMQTDKAKKICDDFAKEPRSYGDPELDALADSVRKGK